MATAMTAEQAQMVVLLTKHGAGAYRMTLAALISAQLGGNPVMYFEVMNAARFLLSLNAEGMEVPPAPAQVPGEVVEALRVAMIAQVAELGTLRVRVDQLEKRKTRVRRAK